MKFKVWQNVWASMIELPWLLTAYFVRCKNENPRIKLFAQQHLGEWHGRYIWPQGEDTETNWDSNLPFALFLFVVSHFFLHYFYSTGVI